MIRFEDFKEIDIRIATIQEVKNHPDAHRLYILKINVGDETKQIVAGIKDKYSSEELIGRKIVVVNNLEPAVIRGENSNAMLLAAGSENGPVILIPESDVPDGSRVR